MSVSPPHLRAHRNAANLLPSHRQAGWPWRLAASGGKVRLRLLLDRGSIEIFGNDGRVALSQRVQPVPNNRTLELTTLGGPARVVQLEVYEINSAW